MSVRVRGSVRRIRSVRRGASRWRMAKKGVRVSRGISCRGMDTRKGVCFKVGF